jgi:thymidine kinase
MAKLYFRYGAVSSAKTLNLLAVAHNYRNQDKRVLIVKPALDNRFSTSQVASRAGLFAEADIVITDNTELDFIKFEGLACILVDEAQFLDPAVVHQLRAITIEKNVPVICYGLRTDFQTKLFEGAQKLFELADSIEEVKTTCKHCNRKAVFNQRLHAGKPVNSGPQILLGADDVYQPVCAHHYYKEQP